MRIRLTPTVDSDGKRLADLRVLAMQAKSRTNRSIRREPGPNSVYCDILG